jgi:glycosidase
MLSTIQRQSLRQRLHRLYGDAAPLLVRRFEAMLGRYGVGLETPTANEKWDHRTSVLITYADTICGEDTYPLRSLERFCLERLKGTVSTIHLLPFFPWSSDDGFSVIDFRKVSPSYGHWEDVERIGGHFELMFDLVLNHCSRKSQWFRDYVTGIAPARWYFLPMDPATDLTQVVRPRPWPLLTKTSTRDGPAHVWTTFSADQVDLNWQNPDLLFEFIDILFLYLSKGCRIFRLDAVAFLWKEMGTSCIHRPQTHEIVKLLREIVSIVSPNALLLTETNVPHEENMSYFGENDEAHMVYNFTLPPLMLFSYLRQNSGWLRRWAAGLPELSPEQAFLNFSASHDGIGVRPLQGLLEAADVDWLVGQVRARGGLVSMKANPDGSESPYELNITYRDALSEPKDPHLGMRRFLASQALVLAFKGIPALYIHSLLGTTNDLAGVEASGQNRSINRRKWDRADLEERLDDPEDQQHQLFTTLVRWVRIRREHPAFHPGAAMQVLETDDAVFAFRRISRTRAETVTCLFNMSEAAVMVPWKTVVVDASQKQVRELLHRRRVRPVRGRLTLQPYQAYWLMEEGLTEEEALRE